MQEKALIFIEDGSFTYDNRVIREADTLVDAGWEITVICPKYPDDPFYKKINEQLRVYFYPKPTAESAAGHLIEHSVSLFWGILLTLLVFLRHGFSVFHACNPMDILWILALPYKALGRKFIFDQHDLSPELYLSRNDGHKGGLFYSALKFLEKASYKYADAVIATNESYKQIAIERGGKRGGDVFVVRNGPDLTKFRQVSPATGYKRDGEILVGYLGNMNIQDGVDYALEAAELIVKSRKDIRFVFIGGGSCQANLAERAIGMGLNGFVKFTGRIPDGEMLATLCACDICIQPDPLNPLNDLSTMNKAMEYMALEKPVVAFDLKETRVSCGEAAIYVSANDTRKLADKISWLADNPEKRAEMGRMGRTRVEKMLAWEYSIPNLLSAYSHVAKS